MFYYMSFRTEFSKNVLLDIKQIICLNNFIGIAHKLRTPNKDINQRNLKIWADVADKICFSHTWELDTLWW